MHCCNINKSRRGGGFGSPGIWDAQLPLLIHAATEYTTNLWHTVCVTPVTFQAISWCKFLPLSHRNVCEQLAQKLLCKEKGPGVQPDSAVRWWCVCYKFFS